MNLETELIVGAGGALAGYAIGGTVSQAGKNTVPTGLSNFVAADWLWNGDLTAGTGVSVVEGVLDFGLWGPGLLIGVGVGMGTGDPIFLPLAASFTWGVAYYVLNQ